MRFLPQKRSGLPPMPSQADCCCFCCTRGKKPVQAVPPRDLSHLNLRAPHSAAKPAARRKFRRAAVCLVPGRSLLLQFFRLSAHWAYRSTFSWQSAVSWPWARMYTFTLGSVPEGRTITLVPSASS